MKRVELRKKGSVKSKQILFFNRLTLSFKDDGYISPIKAGLVIPLCNKKSSNNIEGNNIKLDQLAVSLFGYCEEGSWIGQAQQQETSHSPINVANMTMTIMGIYFLWVPKTLILNTTHRIEKVIRDVTETGSLAS